MYITGNLLESTATFNGRQARINCKDPVLITANIYSDMKLANANRILFVRADHVAKNYIDENGSRTVELTDGTVIHSFTEDYYDAVNHIWKYLKVDYNDYIY